MSSVKRIVVEFGVQAESSLGILAGRLVRKPHVLASGVR